MSDKQKKLGKKHKECKRCGTSRAVIRKYGIGICRRCFKDVAKDIGFEKYN